MQIIKSFQMKTEHTVVICRIRVQNSRFICLKKSKTMTWCQQAAWQISTHNWVTTRI